MFLLIIASFIVINVGVWFLYRLERRKRTAFLSFRKKRVFNAKRKRRRRSLLDPDRGKVIPFPITAASPQGDGPSDSRGTENK